MRAGHAKQKQSLALSNPSSTAQRLPRGAHNTLANHLPAVALCNRSNAKCAGMDAVPMERALARAFTKMSGNCPVGPEKQRGRGWYTPCRTVQRLRRRDNETGPRYAIWTFFSSRRVDLRFPPVGCDTFAVAQRMAFDRLEQAGGAQVLTGRRGGFDLARAGDVVGLDDIA